jgi:hypothetical protein
MKENKTEISQKLYVNFLKEPEIISMTQEFMKLRQQII